MKKLCSIAGFLLLSVSLFSVDVNRDELQSAQSDSVQFENYGGPHAVIETVDAIIGIGTKLGKEVAANIDKQLFAQPYAKYSVIHVVENEERGQEEGGTAAQSSGSSSGLEADILLLNANAGVDHINNLRRIITGYLMAAYNYSREDAEAISVFVTVYNAVYRGQLSNFSSKYKPAVTACLTEEAVGLSTNWEEWAGKTQIVIPLGILSEETMTVETSEISDDKVIEALRSEDSKNVEVREKLAEIKEKEAASAGDKAKAAQKQSGQEKREGKKEAAAASAKTAEKQQKIADKKGEEVKAEKEKIEKDKAQVKKEEIAKAKEAQNVKYLTSLFIVDEKHKLYSLMTVNPKDGQIVKKSSLKQIREKSIFPVTGVTIQNEDGTSTAYNELFLAVCGVKDKRSAIKLCLIDSESLEIKKQSDENLSENSSLIEHGGFFYAIVNEGNKNYLASFDKNLTLKNKSPVVVNGSSPLNLFSEGILVTDEKGNPLLLQIPNLSEIWKKE